MNRFQKKFASTQIKVLFFLAFMGVLFAGSNIYSIYHGTRCEKQFDRVLDKYYTINQFMMLFSRNPVLFDAYMVDKTEQNWMNFINNNNKVRDVLRQMVSEADDMPLESYLLIQSIRNTYINFDMIARNPAKANYEVRQMIDVRQSSSQILECTRKLLEESLAFGTEIHLDMQKGMREEHQVSMILLLLAVVASVLFLFYVKNQVLNPLRDLSHAVNEISRKKCREIRFGDVIPGKQENGAEDLSSRLPAPQYMNSPAITPCRFAFRNGYPKVRRSCQWDLLPRSSPLRLPASPPPHPWSGHWYHRH